MTEDELKQAAADLVAVREQLRAAAIVVGSLMLDLADSAQAEATRQRAFRKDAKRRRKRQKRRKASTPQKA